MRDKSHSCRHPPLAATGVPGLLGFFFWLVFFFFKPGPWKVGVPRRAREASPALGTWPEVEGRHVRPEGRRLAPPPPFCRPRRREKPRSKWGLAPPAAARAGARNGRCASSPPAPPPPRGRARIWLLPFVCARVYVCVCICMSVSVYLCIGQTGLGRERSSVLVLSHRGGSLFGLSCSS